MSDNIEIWKPVVGYEGLYEVSNLGKVKAIKWHRGEEEKEMKPYTTYKGYLRLRLTKNGKGKQFQIHRLVAEAFIPNPENKPYIDHINTDRTDNRVENLRYCTCKENNNFSLARINRSIAITQSYINNPSLRLLMAETFRKKRKNNGCKRN